MRLLVTGGTGFIGSHLAERALRAGHDVSVLGLSDLPEEASNLALLEELGAKAFIGSITDSHLCDEAVQGVTHIDHLAVAMREGGRSDEYFEEVNLSGTEHLLKAAKSGGVSRFIYCSTIGIYGHRFDGVADENSPLAPGNIYEKTKISAEGLVRRFHSEHGMSTAILRPADVYGPRDHRLLKLFRAVARGRFPLFGNGNGRRHMVYIDDVTAAFEMARERKEAYTEPLIVAGPEVCTLRELIDVIQQAAQSSRFGFRLPLRPMLLLAAIVEDLFTACKLDPPIYRRRMDFFHSDSAFDISRARSVLGWSPEVGIQEGVARTLAEYRATGLMNSQ